MNYSRSEVGMIVRFYVEEGTLYEGKEWVSGLTMDEVITEIWEAAQKNEQLELHGDLVGFVYEWMNYADPEIMAYVYEDEYEEEFEAEEI